MTFKQACAAFVLLYALVYIVPLGVRPLVVPDEPRYAEIPREMIESGDWVVPRLNGLRYFEKPALGYWTTAVSISVFGENEFAVRLPSAIAVGLTAFLVYLLAFGATQRARAGLLAAAVYLTSLEVFAVGITNVLDSQLTLFLTGAIASFYWAHLAKRPFQRVGFLALVGIFCGCAFLTKGFLALAIPVLAVAPFLILERRWRTLFTSPWIPILTALIVALPWCIIIHFRDPDFWRYFFWVEHINRFFDSGTTQHPKPLWFFLPYLIGSLLLWIPLFPAVISGLRKRPIPSPMFRFLLLWLGMPFLFFSASSGKLGTYILPCFPPLAILIGLGLDHYLESENRAAGKRTLFTLGAVLAGVVASLVAAFIIISQVGDFAATRWYNDFESGKWILGATAFVMWAVFCELAALQTRSPRAIWLYCAAPLFFMSSFSFIIPESSSDRKMPGAFITEHAKDIPSNAQVFADRYLVHAVCWYLGRSDIHLGGSSGELSYGFDHDDSGRLLLSTEDLVGHIETMVDTKREIVVILMSERYAELAEAQSTKRSVSIPRVKAENQGFVLAVYGPNR